jgi:hypothetical protein
MTNQLLGSWIKGDYDMFRDLDGPMVTFTGNEFYMSTLNQLSQHRSLRTQTGVYLGIKANP